MPPLLKKFIYYTAELIGTIWIVLVVSFSIFMMGGGQRTTFYETSLLMRTLWILAPICFFYALFSNPPKTPAKPKSDTRIPTKYLCDLILSLIHI